MRKASTKTPSHDGRIGQYKVGDTVVMRCIPYHYIGKVIALGEHGLTLAAGAVWLADSARWFDFLKTGKVNETEPFVDEVFVGYGVIAEITKWRHAIPGQT